MAEKIKVIIGQLGSPKSTRVKDVRSYLKEFLGDPRVVDINPFLWKIILNLFVLPFRPKKSAQAYSRIYEEKGFPLITNTVKVAESLREKLDSNLELNHIFLLSNPRLPQVLDEWEQESEFERAQKVLVLPQFPQYAESTIGSVIDAIGKEFKSRVNIPSIETIHCYHHSKAFIDNSVTRIIDSLKLASHQMDLLVISFHGIPLRRVLEKKDLYLLHCLETFELIKLKLHEKAQEHDFEVPPMRMTFQSRFGSETWLGPYTDETVIKCVDEGFKRVAVYCPSFVVDCLETTDEIGHELGEEVEEAGGELLHIPCLNDDEKWISDYAHFINTHANGNQADRENLYYQFREEKIDLEQKYKDIIMKQEQHAPSKLSPESKKTLKLVFLTMFLDLIGFSIIFPMFPAMAKHYLRYDSDNFFLTSMMNMISSIQDLSVQQIPQMSTVVLFGGLLGALYSLLQFLTAPLWGGISDKVGRRPVLLISVFGLFLSYVLWIFSGSFTLLIAARFLGGVMSGNLSIASAVVSDVTDEKNRSKGMAFIGIAFALGFVFGPALGGILSLINPLEIYPHLSTLGINPFSTPAFLAAVLSLINFVLIFRLFPETFKPGIKRNVERSINPIKLFAPLPFKGVNLTNLTYFLFITAFSGMEFTLTFLAVERLGYSSMDNAYMFIFIGFVLGMVQGGYVRRKAHQVGEQKMAFQGLVSVIPGLLILSFAKTGTLLYLGLFFLALGSAMIIPCLTSLVSLYSPSDSQGKSLGIFRSLGSLGRVIGPIYASLIYWKFGSMNSYIIGAVFVILPLILTKRLPSYKNK